jgi:hypothetical protein
MLPMASSRAQRGCAYPSWTRGPAVVDSSVGYRGFAASCPRACSVGALSIACCGAERETPVSWLRCKDSTKTCTAELRTGTIQEIYERALADGTEIR